MSKERELLVRAKVLLECVDTAPLQDQADLIIKEIEELLTQPEPLTPRQGLEEYKRGYDKGWKACKYCYTNEELREGVVGYLYKQMDCHGEWATIFKVDKPYITWHDVKDIVPVYTTQPKREPLSDEAILKIATKVCLEDMGLEMNPQDFKGTGVFELSRAIEKAHGITGVDDETRWSL